VSKRPVKTDLSGQPHPERVRLVREQMQQCRRSGAYQPNLGRYFKFSDPLEQDDKAQLLRDLEQAAATEMLLASPVRRFRQPTHGQDGAP
jgi:hypothetical protein